MEFLCGPILVVLLLNFRRGMRANGSSKESIICTSTCKNEVNHRAMFLLNVSVKYKRNVERVQTEAIIINLLAPEDPPIIDTTRLGVIAIHLVIRFLFHFFILRSKNPFFGKKLIATSPY